MMNGKKTELAVGLFVLAGIACLGYLSVKVARMELNGGGLKLNAVFSTAGGLKKGAGVEIAGVQVGRVADIRLQDFRANVVLDMRREIEVQEDAIARIKTKGLLGEKYVDILPGASERTLSDNSTIRETQPPVDFESLISKFVFTKL